MTKLTEQDIEKLAIEQLQTIGYKHRQGSLINPEGEHQERENYGDKY